MKNVIVFGATGNSGKNIINTLINDGYSVVAVGRSDTDYFDKIDVEYLRGDIQEKDIFRKISSYDFDTVINLAGVQPSILPYSELTDLGRTLNDYVKINILGVFNILEFCRNKGISRYIYTTSHRDIEGHWVDGELLNPDLPIKINYQGDHVMYAITKTSSMMMGDYYRELLGMKVFNLRLPMIFSVPMRNWYYSNGEKKIIPFLSIIRDAILGKTLEVWGDKSMKRDYTHMDNLLQMVKLCLNSESPGGIFNVGTGESVTTEVFIKNIAEVFSPYGEDCKIIYKPEKQTYKCTSYNITKERNLLGYDPIYLREMLYRLKEDIEEKKILNKWEWYD